MTKLTVSSIALAAALALSFPLTSAKAASEDPIPATPSSEANMEAKEAYQNALTDCEMLDNPDRRQLCTEQAQKDYEQMTGKKMEEGKEKPKY